MKSHLDKDFFRFFRRLPDRIKQKARKNYKLWKQNPSHPGLDFKNVHPREPIYSIKVGLGWRALGVKKNVTIIWFWIGSHNDYEKILQQL
ncbi:MAG: ParE family toxin-like protein [Candidatus Anammoxibacter sp.]